MNRQIINILGPLQSHTNSMCFCYVWNCSYNIEIITIILSMVDYLHYGIPKSIHITCTKLNHDHSDIITFSKDKTR